MSKTNNTANTSIEKVITAAIQIPGVKVDREAFLCEIFKSYSKIKLEAILQDGPVNAGIPREYLMKIAKSLVDKRTLTSSGASFVAGLPGGFAMAATIPADMLQFYAVALRLAQEIAYIYGEADLWENGHVIEEKVTNQLILYCGVMLGASGAAATVKAFAASLAKQALVKLPKQALTQKFYFQIAKVVAKAVGIKMTKGLFAKGISKALPVVGGVVSGGITFISMRPMGKRLIDTFDEAHFDYTQEEFEADWREINETILTEQENTDTSPEETPANTETAAPPSVSATDSGNLIQNLRELKALLDEGTITEEEFTELKTNLIKNKINN